MFILNNLIWLLTLVYLSIYGTNYEILVLKKAMFIEFICVLIIIYLIMQVISVYKTNIILNMFKLIYGYLVNLLIGFLGIKMAICEYFKNDIVINKFFISIKRIYSESDYIEYGKEYIINEKIKILETLKIPIKDIYEVIKPSSMEKWKEELPLYLEKLQKDYDLLKELNLEALLNSKLSSITNLFGIPGGKYILLGLIGVGFSVSIYLLFNYCTKAVINQETINAALNEQINNVKEAIRAENNTQQLMLKWFKGEHKCYVKKPDGTFEEKIYTGVVDLIKDMSNSIGDIRLKLGALRSMLLADIDRNDTVENTLYHVLTLLIVVYNQDIPRMQDGTTPEETEIMRKKTMLLLDIIYQELLKKKK